mmetsp:Transcript_11487/g.18752  ORF Transcript_11487/g.18752 Transcript_11487/m.18752 type:complete len:430 (+) Transcript_11487:1042-2331(+)
MDTQLKVLGELLVELSVLLGILGNLVEHIKRLLDQVLLNNSQDLVLLKRLTRDVQRKILGIHHTLHEGQPLRHEVLAVVHDEHTTHVKLDLVVLLLAGSTLEHIERSSLGDEKNSSELELTLNREMLDSQMFLPIIGQGLVKGSVLLVGHVISLAHPDGLLLVQMGPGLGHLLDLLGLLLLLLVLIFINILHLRLVVIILLVFLLLVIIGHLLLLLFLDVEADGEANELGMLLHQVLEALLLKVLLHVLLELKDNAGSTANGLGGVSGDSERTTGSGLPDVLVIIVVLGGHSDLISNKVGGVETDTELTNHTDISTSRKSLHESLGTGLGDGTQVVHQVSLGHTNTGILNGEGLVGLVRDQTDLHGRITVKDSRVGETHVADLVQCIGSIGDQLSKKDFLVGVKGVDNQGKKLIDISGKGESLCLVSHG